MSYEIVRTSEGWILNDSGDVMVRDKDKNVVWVPQNIIRWNENNAPCFIYDTNKTLEFVNSSEETNDELVNERSFNLGHVEVDDQIHTEALSTQEESQQPTEQEAEATNETHGSGSGGSGRLIWSQTDTLALITAVEERYDDMYHVNKRKTFWNVISEVLISENKMFSAEICKKWLNLVRTYKNAKDNQNKTGRGPVKFAYFNRLDELLGDKPTNASPHSIDVSDIPETHENSGNSCDTEPARKRKNPTMELVNTKKAYYEEKAKALKRQEDNRNRFMQQCIENRNAKLKLLARKLELEKRKVVALERLAGISTTQ